MATGYIKQSTYVDGNVITASLFNEDFGALQNAFAYTTNPSTTGHTHDGSASQGGAISKIGDADFHNKIEIDGSSNTIKFFIEVGGTTPTETLNLTASALSPSVASIDLGVSSQPFDVAYINSITIPDSDGTTNRINLGAGTDFNIHYNANNTAVLQSTTASSVIEVDGKTGVKLKTDGTEILATTTTGVTVSGAFAVDTDTLVVDDTNNRVGIGTATPVSELDVDGTISIGGNGSSIDFTGTSGSNFISAKQGLTVDIDSDFNQGAADFTITHDGRTKYLFNVNELGDISFFEDTGTSAKLFWDASAESLGIGTTAPSSLLHLKSSSAPTLKIDDSDSTYALELAQNDVNASVLLKSAGQLTIGVDHDNVASVVAFQTRSDERMRIDSSGNVGIGTTSPDTLLELVGADPILTIRDSETTGANTNATLRLAESGASDTLGNYWDINHTGNGELRFVQDRDGVNNERMRINYAGNLGIGTSEPLGSFHVKNTSDNATPTSVSDSVLISHQSGSYTSGNYYGLLGWARANSNGTTLSAFIAPTMGDSGTYGDLTFGTGVTPIERMRIDSSGNVGIGTTSPANTLTVGNLEASEIDQDATVGIKCNTNHKGLILQENSGAEQWSMGVNANGDLNFYDSAVTDPLVTFQDNSGNVGIGTTSPDKKLHIKDGDFRVEHTRPRIYLTDTNNNSDYSIINNNGDFSIYDDTNAAYRMYINSSGNVGIGTTNPVGSLDIKTTGNVGFEFFPENTTDTNLIINYDRTSGTYQNLQTRAATHQFLIGTSEKMRIDSAGNVGIGIDDPQNKLDVTDTMSVIGTSALLKIDSSVNRAVTISADGAGTTPIDSSLTIKANRGIRLQNYNSTDSNNPSPYRDVLNINETGTGSFALETSSNFYYKERTNLAETVDSNPIVAVGDTDSLFVYDTTKDFDGGQWRLNCLNNSIAVGTKHLPKHMILAADGLLIKIIDPVGKETPYIYGYISISDVASGIIQHIEAKNGYILVFCSAPGVTGNVVLIDLINNNLIKYAANGVLEYYDSNNVHTIQVTTGGKRYKVKTGYGTMSGIYNAFLSFPKKDGFDFESNRPRVRVNLCGSNNALLSYVNKDEYTTYVVTNGTVLGGVHNEENDSIIFYTNSTYTELVDSYTSGFTAYLTSGSSRDARIVLSERRNNNSSLFGRHGDNELISKMSENGRALIMTDGDNSDSLTQIIPLKSLTQRDLQNTRPSHLFSKITQTKTSGIVPSAHTGFTLFSEIQSSVTPTTISTFQNDHSPAYESKDVILTLMPNESSEVVAEVKEEFASDIGDASVPLQRYKASGTSPSDIGAYGLPDEITDAGDEQNIVKIDNETSFVANDNKGFYLSFWVKFAGSHTSAANEDLIKIGLDDGKQFKIALDSNSLPAFYTKSSGTTYGSASLDTPSNSNAPSLTDWVNVTLVKPLKFSGFTQLFVNGVEVDSSVDIDKSVYGITASGTTVQVVCGHKYLLSLVKHYVPISTHDGITTEIVEKIYDLEKPMFTPVAGIKYLTAPSNSSDDNFVTFNKHTKKLKVINTAKTIEYEGLVATDVDSSGGRLQPTTGVSSGAYILAGE